MVSRPHLTARVPRVIHSHLPHLTRRGIKSKHPITVKANENEAIPYKVVQVVGSDGKLGEPEKLWDVLYSVDPRECVVRLVNERPPIVRIIDKQEERVRELRTRRQQSIRKAKAMGRVEMQISWESAEWDVMHKLKKCRRVLVEEGDRVEIAFSHKDGPLKGRLQGADLDKVRKRYPQLAREALDDISFKWKEDEHRKKPLDLMVCYFEPRSEVRARYLADVDDRQIRGQREKDAQKAHRKRKAEEKAERAKLEAEKQKERQSRKELLENDPADFM